MEVERFERTPMAMRQSSKSYRWWFESHNTPPTTSLWLHSTLSDLDEKTQAMLTIIEQDADSFAQRAEMFYKKRPILVNMVEDFYRAHRSLAEQFDNLRHDPGARRTSSVARSFSIPRAQPTPTAGTGTTPPRKSHDGSCYSYLPSSRLIFNSADGGEDYHHHHQPSFPKVKSMMEPDHPLKSVDGPFVELGYGSEVDDGSSGCSEVVDDDDAVESVIDEEEEVVCFGEEEMNRNDGGEDDVMRLVLRGEMERLLNENAMQKAQLSEKERTIKELLLSRKVDNNDEVVVEMREEIERLRVENAEIYLLRRRDDDVVVVAGGEDAKEEETSKLRDEIEKLRSENSNLRRALVKKTEEEGKEVTEQMEAQLKEEVKQLRAEKARMIKLTDAELGMVWEKLELLRAENLVQREMLVQKDEEKREVIRQLTMAIQMAKEENVMLRRRGKAAVVVLAARENKRKSVDFASGLKGFAKMFGWSQQQQGSVVPL